jgi:hypothetical protein
VIVVNANCLTEKLKDRWTKIEDKACQIEAMLLDLEETSKVYSDDFDFRYTKAYIMLETKLNSIRNEQHFIEGLGALTHKE